MQKCSWYSPPTFLLCGESPQFSTALQSKTANSALQKSLPSAFLSRGCANDAASKGLVRFRREPSNLEREAYKGSSRPKVSGRKSPYEFRVIRKNSTCILTEFPKSAIIVVGTARLRPPTYTITIRITSSIRLRI